MSTEQTKERRENATIRSCEAARILGCDEDLIIERVISGDYQGYKEDTPHGPTYHVELPSLDLVYEEVKANEERTSSQAGALDTKSGFVLGSGSLIIAGVASLQGNGSLALKGFTIYGFDGMPFIATSWSTIVHILSIPAVLIYLAVIYCAMNAYRVRAVSQVMKPPRLQQYLASQEVDTKVSAISTLVDGYDHVQAEINAKIKWTEWSLKAFLVESMFLAVILVIVLAA